MSAQRSLKAVKLKSDINYIYRDWSVPREGKAGQRLDFNHGQRGSSPSVFTLAWTQHTSIRVPVPAPPNHPPFLATIGLIRVLTQAGASCGNDTATFATHLLIRRCQPHKHRV